jgi:hypothetical protein
VRLSPTLAVLAAVGTVPLLFGTTFSGLTFLIVPIFFLTIYAAVELGRDPERAAWALPTVFAVGVALAVVSVLTGFLNGFSDEPYSTPAYAALGWGLYTHPVVFTYVQYGRTYLESSYDVYLPLLTFVQVPGVDYRWISLVAWAGAVYLVRANRIAVVGLSAPWIPLLAANGQNDFVPLFALTLALAVPLGRYRWPVEAIALALKQPANVVVFFYHVVRREYMQAVAAVAITIAILAPFLYLDAGAVWCHVVVGDPGSSCTGHAVSFFVFKRNYWLYPTWVVVVFYEPLRQRFRRWIRRGARSAPTSGGTRAGTGPASLRPLGGPASGEAPPRE